MKFRRSLKETWVVIPAYNEGRVISQTLSQFSDSPYTVVVVDDGSKDQTAAYALEHPIILLRHISNLGQGAAIQTGIDFALKFPATRHIITFDADGQHLCSDIPRLIEKLDEGYDVVLGSRFIPGGNTLQMTFDKRLVLFLALLFTRLTSGLKLTDTHNGLRGFRAGAARKLRIQQNQMAHASEILKFIHDQHLRYTEVPVTVVYSEYSKAKGQSIFNGINILWDLFLERFQ